MTIEQECFTLVFRENHRLVRWRLMKVLSGGRVNTKVDHIGARKKAGRHCILFKPSTPRSIGNSPKPPLHPRAIQGIFHENSRARRIVRAEMRLPHITPATRLRRLCGRGGFRLQALALDVAHVARTTRQRQGERQKWDEITKVHEMSGFNKVPGYQRTFKVSTSVFSKSAGSSSGARWGVEYFIRKWTS